MSGTRQVLGAIEYGRALMIGPFPHADWIKAGMTGKWGFPRGEPRTATDQWSNKVVLLDH